jgi:hypothetical protein
MGQGFCTMSAAPEMAFDTGVTQAWCGNAYESGYKHLFEYPMTILEVSTDTFAIDVQLDMGAHAQYRIEALGSSDAPSQIKLIDIATQAVTVYRPLTPAI